MPAIERTIGDQFSICVSHKHYGSILWHDVGKNPILVGYVVLGIGYGVSAHDLSGYKVLGVLVVDNGPHVKEPLTALLKPIPKS